MPTPQDVLDVLVGLAFAGVGLGTRRAAWPMRSWWLLVAATWWLGTVPGLAVVHQGVLLMALAAFPTGRLTWPIGFAYGPVGALVGTGAGGQPLAAAAFALMAALNRHLFPRLACSSLAVMLAGLWTWSRARPDTFAPTPALIGYELLVLLVAVGLPAGMAWHDHVVTRVRDRLLESEPAGVVGLTVELRRVLGRPDLTLVRTRDDVLLQGAEGLDAPTRAAVEHAVQLTVAHEHARDAVDQVTRELERARMRLLAASDRERELVARTLRGDLGSLRRAAASARAHPLLAKELEEAAREIDSLVAGVPPLPLGEGRLPEALRLLCARQAGPVTFHSEHAPASPAAETTMFFVCSEALANVTKHADAATVRVRLAAEAEDLVLVVEDDGKGCADPARGSGLTGLADRLATYKGTLAVSAVQPTGTRLEARVSRSAGTP